MNEELRWSARWRVLKNGAVSICLTKRKAEPRLPFQAVPELRLSVSNRGRNGRTKIPNS